MAGPVPFERIGGHLTVVPVELDGSVPSRFVLDTGIGFPLISRELAQRLGCSAIGAPYIGRRMSGQSLSVPLGVVRSLRLGDLVRHDVTVGIFDLRPMFAAYPMIEGFLAPGFFEPAAFTLRPSHATVDVEDATTLAGLRARGTTVPMQVVRDGPSVTLFTWLRLPTGQPVKVEIDTGSDALILNRPLLEELGLDERSPDVRSVRGTDETGRAYVRWFASLRGPVSFEAAPKLVQSRVEAMFQEIIYDGLLGTRMLDRYDATFDVAGARLTLAPAGP